MAELFGVWSLTGKPAEEEFPPALRPKAVSFLTFPPNELLEFSKGPLWLAAAKGKLASAGAGCAAIDGYAAFPAGGSRLAALASDPDLGSVTGAMPEGHYAMVHADLDRGVLALFGEINDSIQLYYYVSGGLLVFSTSAKPIIALFPSAAGASPAGAAEFILCKDIPPGADPAFSGISKVPPGGILRVSGKEMTLTRRENGLLAKPAPNSANTPEEFKRILLQATETAIGGDRRVAVLLSGGLDSATFAALAREIAGAGNVYGFAYEFDDPGKRSETSYAELSARKLGINFEVVRISYDQMLAAVPETYWRSEIPASPNLHHSRMVLMSRHIARAGFKKAVTGFGIIELLGYFSHHDRYLKELSARLTASLPSKPDLSHWRPALFGRADSRAALPPPPSREIYHQVLLVLLKLGFIDDISGFYPPELSSFVSASARRSLQKAALFGESGPDLFEQLRGAVYNSLAGARLFQSRTKLSGETGAHLIAPALFSSCTAAAKLFSWDPGGGLPQGRVLHKLAVKGIVPADIADRPKIPFDAIMSKDWYVKANSRIIDKLGGTFHALPGIGPHADALKKYFPNRLAQYALWQRMFGGLQMRNTPPQWDDLA